MACDGNHSYGEDDGEDYFVLLTYLLISMTNVKFYNALFKRRPTAVQWFVRSVNTVNFTVADVMLGYTHVVRYALKLGWSASCLC